MKAGAAKTASASAASVKAASAGNASGKNPAAIMKADTDGAALVDAIIDATPEPGKSAMLEIRGIILSAGGKIGECVSYGMPAVRLLSPTKRKSPVLVYYSACKDHLGFYPTGSGIAAFEAELGKWKHSKGAIQFRYGEKLPAAFIRRVVKYRRDEERKRGTIQPMRSSSAKSAQRK